MPELGQLLYNKTHNALFKQANQHDYDSVFKQVLEKESGLIRNSGFIKDYYKKINYQPGFIIKHLYNGDLTIVLDYLNKAGDHGLSPQMFQAEKLKALIFKFADRRSFHSINEAYHDMAELEITASGALINYANALQYGVINPKSIYQRYFMATARPDSAFMGKVFRIEDMQDFLERIQPKSPDYIALQQALKNNLHAPDISLEESKRVIIVNLERLRWKNKPFEHKYVIVNIPDYYLNVIDSGRSVLSMKVCVGKGRNMDNANTLESYADSAKNDKPGDHETPLLNSLIHSVEVNPIWNIPRSIANKEIIVEAAKDPYYLANRGINVYDDDKLVDNPEDIDWTTVTSENLHYDFRQNPGEDNSLGKIKFLFKNKSNVYLHDTPAKRAFYKSMRAVSHGCVRLGDPQALALNLFGQGDDYETISNDMTEGNPDPTNIALPKKVPVYITYVTCWPDENGALQFRNDVYGLDIVLYDHLMRLMYPVSSKPKQTIAQLVTN